MGKDGKDDDCNELVDFPQSNVQPNGEDTQGEEIEIIQHQIDGNGGVFNGDERWLDVSVDGNGGGSGGSNVPTKSGGEDLDAVDKYLHRGIGMDGLASNGGGSGGSNVPTKSGDEALRSLRYANQAHGINDVNDSHPNCSSDSYANYVADGNGGGSGDGNVPTKSGNGGGTERDMFLSGGIVRKGVGKTLGLAKTMIMTAVLISVAGAGVDVYQTYNDAIAIDLEEHITDADFELSEDKSEISGSVGFDIPQMGTFEKSIIASVHITVLESNPTTDGDYEFEYTLGSGEHFYDFTLDDLDPVTVEKIEAGQPLDIEYSGTISVTYLGIEIPSITMDIPLTTTIVETA